MLMSKPKHAHYGNSRDRNGKTLRLLLPNKKDQSRAQKLVDVDGSFGLVGPHQHDIASKFEFHIIIIM